MSGSKTGGVAIGLLTGAVIAAGTIAQFLKFRRWERVTGEVVAIERPDDGVMRRSLFAVKVKYEHHGAVFAEYALSPQSKEAYSVGEKIDLVVSPKNDHVVDILDYEGIVIGLIFVVIFVVGGFAI